MLRRCLLLWGAAILLNATAAKAAPQDPTAMGDGSERYRWVKDWMKLPPGFAFGPTHGDIVVDAKDRVIISNDGENAIVIVDTGGKLLKSWGKDLQGGIHGMRLAKEGDREVLWLAHIGRHEVLKCTLDGEVLLRIKAPNKPEIYAKPEEFVPTALDIAPNGDVYVVDGYGKNWVHVWNAKGEYVRSWNGAEGKAGAFNNPHGIGLDLRGPEPRVVVADRANHRLQLFTLDGKYVDVVQEGLRLPSKVVVRQDVLMVPDLQGRVTMFDKNYKVIAQLGDNANPALRGQFAVPREQWVDGQFISPHGAAWDSHGDLYVEDWNQTGRVSKLERIK
jgi:hypothetical protein